jgi:hypothetical protein
MSLPSLGNIGDNGKKTRGWQEFFSMARKCWENIEGDKDIRKMSKKRWENIEEH